VITVTDEQKESRLAKARAWKAANREKCRAARAAYYAANRERENIQTKAWCEANAERYKDNRKRYYEANREKISAKSKAVRKTAAFRTARNAKERAKYHSNTQVNIEKRLRASFQQALRRASIKKTETVFALVGCSSQALMRHLESLFLPGMSWDRRAEIHIDHVRPVSSFDLTDPEQQRQCFHYTNLQPLWADDNRRKGARYDTSTDD
jgi:hypothetical protein